MDAAETTASFFPPPPPRYSLFTDRNLSLADSLASSGSTLPQREALVAAGATEDEATSLDDVDLRTLAQPPRLDWIEENGGWTAFGEWERWPGQEPRPALEGMPKLYPEGSHRKDALHALLQTLLHSYLSLLSTLSSSGPPSLAPSPLDPPPPQPTGEASVPADPAGLIAHIELVAFNMHGLCNELRPQQARETLKVMAREMAKERRERAEEINETCAQLREKLASLRASLQDPVAAPEPVGAAPPASEPEAMDESAA